MNFHFILILQRTFIIFRDVMEVVQKHIRAAKARTANFSVKNEGDINLFEMSVELNSDNTQKQQGMQR